MEKKILMIIILCMSVLLVSGCSGNDDDNPIYKKLIEANKDIETYKFDLDTNATMIVSTSVQSMEVSYRSISEGAVDRDNKELELSATVKSSIAGMENEAESDIYIVDDEVYMSVLGRWLKDSLESDLWKKSDQIGQMTKLVEKSRIEILGDDSFDGNDYYVVKLEPDLDKLGELLLDQKDLGSDSDDLDYSDIIKEYAVTIWINKETYHIEKSSTKARMVIDSDGSMRNKSLDYSVIMHLRDINEPLSIELPAEAKTATKVKS